MNGVEEAHSGPLLCCSEEFQVVPNQRRMYEQFLWAHEPAYQSLAYVREKEATEETKKALCSSLMSDHRAPNIFLSKPWHCTHRIPDVRQNNLAPTMLVLAHTPPLIGRSNSSQNYASLSAVKKREAHYLIYNNYRGNLDRTSA